MKFEQKRKLLTNAAIILGVVLGALITRANLKTQPIKYVSDVVHEKSQPVQGVPGFVQQSVLVNRNGATVWMSFEPKPGCDHGDLDFILQDMGFIGVHSLLVTAEPLLDTDWNPLRGQVSQSSLDRGTEVNFTFPYSEEPQHFGVFLCSDKAGTGSCKNKPQADFSRTKLGQNTDDQVFFFTYLLLQGDKAHFFANTANEMQIRRLTHHLRKDVGVAKEDIDRIDREIRALTISDNLRTGRVLVEGPRVRLVLPRLGDASKCQNIQIISVGVDMHSGKTVGKVRKGKTTRDLSVASDAAELQELVEVEPTPSKELNAVIVNLEPEPTPSPAPTAQSTIVPDAQAETGFPDIAGVLEKEGNAE